jgi:ABC-type Zn uptake system ZnuABC Zn-binding protein ZnuA
MALQKKLLSVSFSWWLLITLLCGAIKVDAQELRVVATNSILADLVKNVGGTSIQPAVLVGANGDPHTFEPTPKDNVLLRNADVIFENGLHLEPWLDKLYASSGSKAVRYRATEGLKLIQNKGYHEDDEGSEVDPHVWHDVGNAISMVEIIRDALVKTDPIHADDYQRNASIYLTKLSALDAWIIQEALSIPKERRKLVTSHDTFGYFALRYGFQIVGAVIDSATTETADPSALKVADLVGRIKASGVPAVFVENVANPKMLQAVAREAHVKVSPQLYSDALGNSGTSGEDYIKMMEYNVRTIVEALR